MWWRSEVEGVLLLPLPVCLQSRFQQCQHVLAPTGALLCCCLIEYAGCCVAAGCESRWGHLSETEEQTGSQTARRYSAGCSLPQSGVLWQLSDILEILLHAMLVAQRPKRLKINNCEVFSEYRPCSFRYSMLTANSTKHILFSTVSPFDASTPLHIQVGYRSKASTGTKNTVTCQADAL